MAQISQGPKFMEKFKKKMCDRLGRYICLLRVWIHFIELFNSMFGFTDEADPVLYDNALQHSKLKK